MRLVLGLLAALTPTLIAAPAVSGVYSDALAQCLVTSSSDADKTILTRWIFAAFSENPSVKDLVSVTEAQRDTLNHQFAELSQRLLVKDCRKETVDALKHEGLSVIETSFQVLGQTATRQMMSDPMTQAEVAGFTKYLDKQAFDDLGREAGVAPGEAK